MKPGELNPFHQLDFQTIKKRLGRKVERVEWLILLLVFSFLGLLCLFQNDSIYPVDLVNYLNAPHRNFEQFFYLPVWVPLLALLEKLPLRYAWLIWGTLNILGFWFAWRTFGGPIWSWLTASLFFVIFYGQISGVLAGGLAAYWIALSLNNWFLIGVSACIVSSKYIWGVPLVLIFSYLAGNSKRIYLRSLVVFSCIVFSFILIYPEWAVGFIQRFYASPPNDQASISLWRYIGPISLLLWAVPFLLPIKKVERLALVFFATPLVVPYFQPHDLLVWFAFPLGIIPLFSNATFVLLSNFGLSGLRFLAIIPFSLYTLGILRYCNLLSPKLVNKCNR
ncbi:MAG: hypothetical protein AB1522_07305 [Chloroflexota bacterium]